MLSFILIPGIHAQAFNPDCSFCSPGDRRCGGDGNTLITCGDDNVDGCWEWSIFNQVFCANGCFNGQCEESGESILGENFCEFGQTRCGGNNLDYVIHCGDDDGDGFREWSVFNQESCPDGCRNGACTQVLEPTGINLCDFGDSRCTGTDLKYISGCGDQNGDGFREFVTFGQTFCQFGCEQQGDTAFCQNEPEASCSNLCESGQAKCGGTEGTVIQNCADDNNDGCLEFSVFNQEICQYGCTQNGTTPYCANRADFEIPTVEYETDNSVVALYHFDQQYHNDLGFLCTPDQSVNQLNFGWSSGTPNGKTNVTTGFMKIGNGSLNISSSVSLWDISNQCDDDFVSGSNKVKKRISISDVGTIEFYILAQNGARGPGDHILDFTDIFPGTGFLDEIKFVVNDDGFMEIGIFINDQKSQYNNSNFDQDINFTSVTNITDFQWHHIALSWGNIGGVNLFIDGASEGFEPYLGGFFLRTVNMDIIKANDEVETYIDELRISNIQRHFTPISQSLCKEGATRCGGIGKSYIIPCQDDNNDGSFEWSIINNTLCPFGCLINGTNAECKSSERDSVFSEDLCTLGQTRCDVTGQYRQPCEDRDNDGFTEFSPFNWTWCQFGCNIGTGNCNQCQDRCNLTETKCDILDITNIRTLATARQELPNDLIEDPNLKEIHIIRECVFWNSTGCFDWSINNLTRCGFGCQDSVVNNNRIAACFGDPSISNTFRSSIESGSNFLIFIADENPGLQMIIVAILAMFVTGGITLATNSTNFGMLAGIGIVLIAGFVGWIHPFITLAIIILAAFIFYKATFGGGE